MVSKWKTTCVPEICRIAVADSTVVSFSYHIMHKYMPSSSAVALGISRVLCKISDESIVLILDLSGSMSPLFDQLMLKLPYPLAEQVKTPPKGAAAYATLGWMTIFGSATKSK